jgi:hypothetical protein
MCMHMHEFGNDIDSNLTTILNALWRMKEDIDG